MRPAYDRPTTQIVSCKSNLQLAYNCRVRHKKYYDNNVVYEINVMVYFQPGE